MLTPIDPAVLKRRFRAPALAVPKAPSRAVAVDDSSEDDSEEGSSAQFAPNPGGSGVDDPELVSHRDAYFESLEGAFAEADELLPGISEDFRFAPEPKSAPVIRETPLMSLDDAVSRLPESLRLKLADRLRVDFREVRRLPRKARET